MTQATSLLERLLREAGVGPGMRVLDVGCGGGEVSFLLAGLVGHRGQVLGVDREPAALEAARRAAKERGLGQASFREADLDGGPLPGGPWHAVVGRRVLMYLPDPGALLVRLAAELAPGGVMVFQEHSPGRATQPLDPFLLHEKVRGWIWRTVAGEGADPDLGFKLAGVLAGAGLTVRRTLAEAVIPAVGQTTDQDLARIVGLILPRILAQGVAEATEIDLATLGERLEAERRAAATTYIGDLAFGAWGKRP